MYDPNSTEENKRVRRTPEEICEYVKTLRNENNSTLDGTCWGDSDCDNDFIKFNEMYYCHFNLGGTAKKILFIPIYCFMFFIFMYNMSSTADEYLSPALEYVTVKFGIPESLAGVTLLAFGNGAPDVFSSISSGDDNAINSMSPLFGSSLFITTVVIFLATKAGVNGSIQVNKTYFIRDLVVFILMEFYLLFLLFVVRKITIPISLSFAGAYAIYVIIVVIQSRSEKEEDQDEVEASIKAGAIDLLETNTKYKKAYGKPGSVANLESYKIRT